MEAAGIRSFTSGPTAFFRGKLKQRITTMLKTLQIYRKFIKQPTDDNKFGLFLLSLPHNFKKDILI